MELNADNIIQLCKKELNLIFRLRGKDYFSLCPFHSEKTPSFAFDSSKKIFKCFGCGSGAGNIFKLWSQVKKTTLLKSRQEIKQLGYEVGNQDLLAEKEEEKEVFPLLSLITQIYQHNLFSSAGRHVLDYLYQKRNLNNQMIEKFGLGCSINYKQLAGLFSAHDDRAKELVLIGLLRDSKNGQVYDFFSEIQLIIPLKNEKAEVVAFAARQLESSTWLENKYHYLPNYEGYQKSSLLYNYWSLKQMPESNYCYLVEGFFDVISLNKAGVVNCLAILGTNVSQTQINMLKKLGKKIILFLDGDQAGKKATVKIALDLLVQDVECEIISHDLNCDPDEICRSHQEKLSSILQKKEDPYSFLLKHFQQVWEIRKNPQSIASFISQTSSLFKGFKEKTHDFLIEKISLLIGWKKEEVKEIYFASPTNEKNPPDDSDPLQILNQREKYLLAGGYHNRRYWLILWQQNYHFSGQENRICYQFLTNFYTNNWTWHFPLDNKTNIIDGINCDQIRNTIANNEFSEEKFRQMLQESKEQQINLLSKKQLKIKNLWMKLLN